MIEREEDRERECEEGRRLAERRRKLGRENAREVELRGRETKRGERASKRRTTVQSGGTRGARKAVVCRGPPHWHTVIRYNLHRTLDSDSHSHQRSHNTTSASAVRNWRSPPPDISRDRLAGLNSKQALT